jgi:hypothetical protein
VACRLSCRRLVGAHPLARSQRRPQALELLEQGERDASASTNSRRALKAICDAVELSADADIGSSARRDDEQIRHLGASNDFALNNACYILHWNRSPK